MARIIRRSRRTLKAYRYRGRHRHSSQLDMSGALELVSSAPWPYAPTSHSL